MRTTKNPKKIVFYSDNPDDYENDISNLFNDISIEIEDKENSNPSQVVTTTIIQNKLLRSQTEKNNSSNEKKKQTLSINENENLDLIPSVDYTHQANHLNSQFVNLQIEANNKNAQKKEAIASVTQGKFIFKTKFYDLENWGGIKTRNPIDGFENPEGESPTKKMKKY